MFAGMMFGVVGRGTCSDLMGHSAAFNATLFLISLRRGQFTCHNIPMLGICIFLLGNAVGGFAAHRWHPSLGTYVPRKRASRHRPFCVILWRGARGHSIHVTRYRHLLIWTFGIGARRSWSHHIRDVLGRIVFFRLHESPRYLVHVGRKQDALESLRMISRFNDSELALDLDEVEDHIRVPRSHLSDSAFLTENRLSSSRLFNADSELSSPPIDIKVPSSVAQAGIPLSSTPPDGTEASLVPVPFYPAAERTSFHDVPPSPKEEEVPTADPMRCLARARALAHPVSPPGILVGTLFPRYDCRCTMPPTALPRRIRRPVRAWLSRFAMVLEPEWRRLMGHWWGIMLAFTMFKVYLPKLLETRRLETFTTSSLKRRMVDRGRALEEDCLWLQAVLYGWTPEIFATKSEERHVVQLLRSPGCGMIEEVDNGASDEDKIRTVGLLYTGYNFFILSLCTIVDVV
ncbi:hypothetical protein BJV77DRAFT_963635 [Russula vinacea]|nr:hypothetical protein BJV77DRAFT_963635 [Russula vinacea]